MRRAFLPGGGGARGRDRPRKTHRADVGVVLAPRETTRVRAGFTLLEAVIGVAILSLSVLALSQAVGAVQMQSIESQKQVLGVMAADDLLSEISSLPYAALKPMDGRNEPVGQMQTVDGAAYPSTYFALGRRVSVADATITVGTGGTSTVIVKGVKVTVTAFDAARDVANAELFVSEPAS